MFTSLTIALSREYLTGFSKRKADRRRRFAEKMKKEMKTERKRLQVELREKIKKSNRDVPEVAHLLDDEEVEEEKDEPNVYELPEATVTISSITDNQLRQENVFLGNNTKIERATASGDENDVSAVVDRKKQSKEMNRTAMKKLKKSKAYKRVVQVGRDKNRKRSKRGLKKKK